MIPIKPALFFMVKCSAIYFVLLLLYKAPGAGQSFSYYVQGFSTVVTMPYDVSWENNYEKDKEKDILVKLRYQFYDESRENPAERMRTLQASQTMQTWKSFFMPLAILLALILAMKIDVRRKLRNLGLGLLGIHLYFAVFLLLFMAFVRNFNESGGEEGLFYQLFNRNAGYITIVPVIIWGIVVFRVQDLKINKPEE